MRLATVLLCSAAVALTTACVSAADAAKPDWEEHTLVFDSPDALDHWHETGGDWRISGDRLVGRSLDPGGTVTNEYATYTTYFGEIERVIIQGGLGAESPHNFRFAVGGLSVLLNWEHAAGSWFELGHHERRIAIAPLCPGQEHEIVVEQVGDRVRVVVDDHILWEHEGRLRGAVSLHPCFGSTLWVREIVIHGRPVEWIDVAGPDGPIM